MSSAQRTPTGSSIYVRFWHLADEQRPSIHVRFQGKSGHRNEKASRLLLTQSEHL